MNMWVVIVAGQMVAPGYFSDFDHGHDDCIKRAIEVGGACIRVPDPPEKGTPEYDAWAKVYCNGTMYIGGTSGPCVADLKPVPLPPGADR